jgi:anti-anti-sigma factor
MSWSARLRKSSGIDILFSESDRERPDEQTGRFLLTQILFAPTIRGKKAKEICVFRTEKDTDTMPLNIKLQQTDKNTVKLILSGQINSETWERLDRQITELLGKKIMALILDLADVDYISSAGVGAIIKAKMSLMRNYGDLAILNPQPQVRKVFDIMKLLPAMNVFANIKELDEYLTRIQKQVVEGTALKD